MNITKVLTIGASLLLSVDVLAQSNINAQEIINLVATEDTPTRFEFEAIHNKKLAKLVTKFTSGNWVNTLTLQGDVDEKNPSAVFADLDGLNNGTKAAIEFVYSSSNEASLRFFESACLSTLNTKLARDDLNFMNVSCADGRSLLTALEDAIPKHRFGFSFSTNNEKFEWADAATLASDSDTKSGYDAGLSYIWTPTPTHQFKAGIRRQEVWRGGKKQLVCVPNTAVTGALNCNDLIIGAPTDKESDIISAEWKTYLGRSNRYALSVKVSHNGDANTTGIEVPIYIYQRTFEDNSKKNTLNGGIRFGFVDTKDNDDEFSVGLFFNKPFDLSI